MQWAPQGTPASGPDRGSPAPIDAKAESRRTAPSWPSGQSAGALASAMGRRSSKVESQVRQRYSYSGIADSIRIGTWLTGPVPELEMRPVLTRTDTDPDVDRVPETGEPAVAHIVKTEPGEAATAKVLEARIYGTPVEALCGHVWVPSRDPKQLPLCQKCKDIYETYRAFNDGLHDRPED